MRRSRVVGFPHLRRPPGSHRPPRIELLSEVPDHERLVRDLPLAVREVGYTGFTVDAPVGFRPGLVCRFRFRTIGGEAFVLAAVARSTRPTAHPSSNPQVSTTFAFATAQARTRAEVIDLVQRIGRLVLASRPASEATSA